MFGHVLGSVTNPLLFLGGTLAFIGSLVIGLVCVILAVQPSVFGLDPLNALIAAQAWLGAGWIFMAFGIFLATIAVVLPRRR